MATVREALRPYPGFTVLLAAPYQACPASRNALNLKKIAHHKEEPMAGQLYTTGKLAEALGISAGKVKKLLDELKVKEDAAKGACKYYGEAALKKLKAVAK
ncbi:MAG: hypothetical protein ABSG21_08030 [Spirochaetia bacterium]